MPTNFFPWNDHVGDQPWLNMFVDLQMMTWYKLVAGNSGKKYFMFDGVIFVKKSIGNYFKVIVSWKEPIEITFQQKKTMKPVCLTD